MSNCAICSKTVYPIEAVKDGALTWHKGCFKCATCSSSLTLKNFTKRGNAVYCAQHVPKESHTQVADGVATRHAASAQKTNMGGKVAKVNRDEAGYSGGGGGYEEAPAEGGDGGDGGAAYEGGGGGGEEEAQE